MIVAGEEAVSRPKHEAPGASSDEDTRLRDALVLRQFLDHNCTQLTFHGLWTLYNLDSGLYAFIRNSHLSVLHKYHPAGAPPSLWTLVTDSNLVPEPSIIWESLEDVDGAASRFVDRDLRPSSTSGGDFAGDISDHHPGTQVADLLLAQQLQAHEDELALQLERAQISDRRGITSNQDEPAPSMVQQPDPTLQKPHAYPAPEKRKKECMIM